MTVALLTEIQRLRKIVNDWRHEVGKKASQIDRLENKLTERDKRIKELDAQIEEHVQAFARMEEAWREKCDALIGETAAWKIAAEIGPRLAAEVARNKALDEAAAIANDDDREWRFWGEYRNLIGAQKASEDIAAAILALKGETNEQ
jgi:predicted  nucleic acid-binding Zn-ribbon protein